jgi:hypothetical protein
VNPRPVDLSIRVAMAREWFADEPEKRDRVERVLHLEEIAQLRAQVDELRARLRAAIPKEGGDE